MLICPLWLYLMNDQFKEKMYNKRRMKLLAGTVPANNLLLATTVQANYALLAGTVPASKE
jgi:hypothetical protein